MQGIGCSVGVKRIALLITAALFQGIEIAGFFSAL
jgi:hypothetical protein